MLGVKDTIFPPETSRIKRAISIVSQGQPGLKLVSVISNSSDTSSIKQQNNNISPEWSDKPNVNKTKEYNDNNNNNNNDDDDYDEPGYTNLVQAASSGESFNRRIKEDHHLSSSNLLSNNNNDNNDDDIDNETITSSDIRSQTSNEVPEIQIEDLDISRFSLGKGAFGQVFAGQWRKRKNYSHINGSLTLLRNRGLP